MHLNKLRTLLAGLLDRFDGSDVGSELEDEREKADADLIIAQSHIPSNAQYNSSPQRRAAKRDDNSHPDFALIWWAQLEAALLQAPCGFSPAQTDKSEETSEKPCRTRQRRGQATT